MWLWYRLVATALIRPLTWEFLRAVGTQPPPKKNPEVFASGRNNLITNFNKEDALIPNLVIVVCS